MVSLGKYIEDKKHILGHERKVFIVRGNTRIPAIAVPTLSTIPKLVAATSEGKKAVTPPPKLLEKEIKEEPLDEETSGAMVNITTSSKN